MDHPLIWISLCFGFGCSQFHPWKYYYVDMRVNFKSAQNYCREYYKDVATVTSSQDMSMMIRPSTNQEGVWIGLNDDPANWKGVMGNGPDSWRWSLTGQTGKTSYCNWIPGQPDFIGAAETCGLTVTNGQWADINCNARYWSICMDTNAQGKFFVLVQTVLSWKDAQANCRRNHIDLATVENADDTSLVTSVNLGNYTWIGLYRVPWFWSDHNTSLFRNFAVHHPNNVQQVDFCVAELPDHTWTDTLCSLSLAFFCYEDSRLKTVLTVRSQTNADMTDPAINAQVLQQIEAELQNQGGALFELKWNVQPTKA